MYNLLLYYIIVARFNLKIKKIPLWLIIRAIIQFRYHEDILKIRSFFECFVLVCWNYDDIQWVEKKYNILGGRLKLFGSKPLNPSCLRLFVWHYWIFSQFTMARRGRWPWARVHSKLKAISSGSDPCETNTGTTCTPSCCNFVRHPRPSKISVSTNMSTYPGYMFALSGSFGTTINRPFVIY